MNNTFTYRILQYVHSEFLGENLNVGILFHFENSNKYFFKHPTSFKRLKEAYPDFSEKQLFDSLKAIEQKVNKLNRDTCELFIKKDVIIEKDILINDSTALQFSELKISISYHTNPEKIIQDFFLLFFYQAKVYISRFKHDE